MNSPNGHRRGSMLYFLLTTEYQSAGTLPAHIAKNVTIMDRRQADRIAKVAAVILISVLVLSLVAGLFVR
jgi:hypothetical protein